MSETPEEIFNRNVWQVLQDIHGKSLYMERGGVFDFELSYGIVASGYPSGEEEEKILYRLNELQVAEIIGEVTNEKVSIKKGPKFDEYYKKIEQKVNPNSVPVSEKQKMETRSSTSIEKNIGFLLIDGGKIEIGPAKNIPFKLLEALCPFSAVKAVNAVFDMSSTDRSKFKKGELTLLQKQEVLRSRIKELQNILQGKKVKLKLVFKDDAETVYMERIKG